MVTPDTAPSASLVDGDETTARLRPAIELTGVTKRYGDVLAVDALDVEIAQGEFFALLGPSGCGKTSTLKMMAGFELPDSGEVLLEGEVVTRTPPFHRDVNLVFQDYALFPHLNLRDNVAFGLKIKGVSRAERRRRADEMLARMELPGLGDRRIAEISGGQQQRVALARALINHPKVLLLDEPLGALDLKLRRAMQLELKAIQRDVGISFVYVTHDQEEALAMADRIAVMSAGKALQIGSPREIYDHPSNRFVADFIGESSFLRGSRGGADGAFVSFELPDGRRIKARPGSSESAGDAVAMIRPEHTTLHAEGTESPGSEWNQIGATVGELEYGGSDVHYFVNTPSGDRVQSRMPASAETFEPGTRVQIRFPVVRTVVVNTDATVEPEPSPDTGGSANDDN
ncbi:MAG TPA: ABC transporter ATP-binding protein [Solirubrobacterales bacterium]|nr:ABC transporter ATP-binding protein [Solirubrobacterales bacterium]